MIMHSSKSKLVTKVSLINELKISLKDVLYPNMQKINMKDKFSYLIWTNTNNLLFLNLTSCNNDLRKFNKLICLS